MQKQIKITIPFYDLDPMNVVWHGNYVKYMEQARCALLSDVGMTYDDMLANGVVFPVVTMQTKYIHPCTFGQVINVIISLVPDDNFLIFKYKITDDNTGKILFNAETKQMAVDIETKESLFEIPKQILCKFQG